MESERSLSPSSSVWARGETHHCFPYIRQVLTLCILPELKESNEMPDDICGLASTFQSWCDGYSIGSYNDLVGMKETLNTIKEYIGRRDHIDYKETDQIMIAAGLEMALTHILPVLPGCHGDGSHGILIPGPVFPPIRDSVEVAGFTAISYYLKEKDGRWTFDMNGLSEIIERSACPIMCIFVQNPGYPTGHIYNTEEMEDIIRVAKKNELVIFAMENLQMDIHDPAETPFISMRKTLLEMGNDFKSVQLLSFYTPNKSIIGEPGMSVTYVHAQGLGEDLFDNLMKLTHNPPVIQQFYMTLMLSPCFITNSLSYKKFTNEKEDILNRVGRIGKMVAAFFNSLPYIECTEPKAGHTVFARLKFPKSWTYIGPRSSASLEEFYCQQLMDATTVSIVAGKFFNEYPGSSHFKFSFPVDEVLLLQTLDQFKHFHQTFIMTMVK